MSNNKQKILDKVHRLAKVYTPEWNISKDDPGPGYAFAEAFADMYSEVLDKYDNELYRKYKIEIANLIGANLKSNTPASGIIGFKISSSDINEDIDISKDKKFYINTEEDKRVVFETLSDTNIRSTNIEKIICCDNNFFMQQDVETSSGNILLGRSNNKTNRYLILHSEKAFNVSDGAKITVYFEDGYNQELESKIIEVLSDKENVLWQYIGENYIYNLTIIGYEGNSIKLLATSDEKIQKESESNKLSSGCVMGTIRSLKNIERLQVRSIKAGIKNMVKPQTIINNDMEIPIKDAFIFNDRFSIYDMFYIKSDESFSKINSEVNIRLDLSYGEYKDPTYEYDQNIYWKMIMKERDFPKMKIKSVKIERIVWEYWNGIAWKRLIFDNEKEVFFASESNSVNIKFILPNDIRKTIVNGNEGYYIRCRITKISNEMHTNVKYIYPILKDICIHYDSKDKSLELDSVEAKDLFESSKIKFSNGDKITLFEQVKEETAVYFKFDSFIEIGSFSFYVDVEKNLSLNEYKWEIYSRANGTDSFRDIVVIDETQNLTRNGLITLLIDTKAVKNKIFGEIGYWIRLKKINTKDNVAKLPIIKRIIPNAVKVIQKDSKKLEYFKNNEVKQNIKCHLSEDNIYDIKVYVNEMEEIGDDSSPYHYDESKYILNYDSDNQLIEAWRLWDKVDDFCYSQNNDRHYMVDYIKGIIIFGDGVYGKIPPENSNENIMVKYSTTMGTLGNISKDLEINSVDSIPYIEKIFTVTSISGGKDIEIKDEAVIRNMNRIKHKDRIVCTSDYINIIKGNCKDIVDIKLSFMKSNNINTKNNLCITVLIDKTEFSDYYFEIVKKKIEKIISSYSPITYLANTSLDISHAKFVQVSIKLDAYIDDYLKYKQYSNHVNREISNFLDTQHGNFDKNGWKIGNVPSSMDINQLLKKFDFIKKIDTLIISYRVEEDGQIKEYDYDSIIKNPSIVVTSDKHQIMFKYNE